MHVTGCELGTKQESTVIRKFLSGLVLVKSVLNVLARTFMDQVHSAVILQLDQRGEQSVRSVYQATIIIKVLLVNIDAYCSLDLPPLQWSLCANNPSENLASTVNKCRSIALRFEDAFDDPFISKPSC